MGDELNVISKAVSELGEKIEKSQDLAFTKVEARKMADALAALEKAQERKAMEEKTEVKTIFANKAQARDFIDQMKGAIDRSGMSLEKSSGFYREKTAGDPLTTGATNAGVDLVPTALSDNLSMLITQGSVARKYATVYHGVQGNYDLAKRNGTSTAVFTAADDSDVTATQLGTAKVTLSPKQISALSLVSNKLLYVTPISIANAVAIDLVEQAGVLEDNAVIRGDNSAGYGGITGLNTTSGLGQVSVAYNAWTVDSVLGLIPQAHESVQNTPNAKFFMSGAFFSLIQQTKASTSGVYNFDITKNAFTLGGAEIVIWHRVDNTAVAGKYPVFYGDLGKAVNIGIGRDMSLEVDRSFKFGSNQTAFRLSYDMHAVTIQAAAVSRLKLTT